MLRTFCHINSSFYIFSKRTLAAVKMSRLLALPAVVQGMTQLNEELFKVTIPFPALCVKSREISKIRAKIRLEKWLMKSSLANVKLVADTEDKEMKLLLFDPDSVKPEYDELRKHIVQLVSEVAEFPPTWHTHNYELNIDNWTSKSIIRAILPENLDFSSFTQTGHIIHCNFKEELSPYKKVIGEVLLRKVRNARTVINKIDGISSKYRNFQIELVAGEEDYLTEVSEQGIRYKMDFSKVFWNSRLQHEHLRVLGILNKDSLVFDTCAGIGPFVLPAAKTKRCRLIYANDLNPDSVKWLETNKEINKLQAESVKSFNMDAVEFIKGPVADALIEQLSSENERPIEGAHILMNLPAFSINFLPAFKGLLNTKLDYVENKMFPIYLYSYLFVKAHEDVEDQWYIDRAYEMVKEKLGWYDGKYDNRISAHHVRTVSNFKEMFCMKISIPFDHLVNVYPYFNNEEPPEKRLKSEE